MSEFDVSKEIAAADTRLSINNTALEMPLDITIRSIALSVAQRHAGDTTVKEGNLYQRNPPVSWPLDADEVDELIERLAYARSSMIPPVPLDDDPDPGSRFLTAANGRWWVIDHPDRNQMMVAFLHPGLRWVAMLFDYPNARNLMNKIRHNLRGKQ